MKRVLIVYHSFDEWEMGPIRLRRMARTLARHGFEPVVLTSAATSRSTGEVPPGVEVLRVPALDLGDVYRRLRHGGRAASPDGGTESARNIGFTSWINRWLLVPDKHIPWARPALRRARAYLQAHPVDLIFASLAPRTNVVVAARLARAFGLPCVIEYRDLWTGSPYHHLAQPTFVHDRLHARLERAALRAATRVTCVSRGLRDYLRRRYAADLRAEIALNYNFFDPAEYPQVPPRQPGAPFVISYVGALYASRHPFAFFEGLRRLLDGRGLEPRQVRFRWVGSVLGVPDVEREIRRLRLEPYIDRIGQVPHADALRHLCASDVSLLIQAPDDTMHIPGKLFEAMGARVPLLAVAPPCETTEILTRTKAGFAAPHDASAVCARLGQFVDWHRTGTPWPFDEAAVREYDVGHAVGRLAGLFEEAIAACR